MSERSVFACDHPTPVRDVPFGMLRGWWIVFSVAVLPIPLRWCGIPPAWMPLVCCLTGLAAVFPLRCMDVRALSLRDVLCSFVSGIALSLLTGGVTLLMKLGLTALRIPFAEKQTLAVLIAESSQFGLAVLFFAVCVLTPVLEEVLFRKLLFGYWRKIHPGSAFWGAVLLFAAVHLFLLGFPGLFLLGCGFQYLYLRRKNLACAMIAHGTVNTIAFAANLWMRWI